MVISGWGVFLVLLLLAVVLGGGGYIGYTHFRARRLGLPPPALNPFARARTAADNPTYHAPAPAPSGVQAWVVDKFNALRNSRTAGGAYESTGYAGGGAGGSRRSGGDRRGFGALDPDEAWDSRVDNEASGYYEEQELGALHDPAHGPYGGGGYGGQVGVGGIEVGRGRSRSRQRELDDRYDEEVHGGGDGGGAAGLQPNPFGDHAEASSLRAVSPRPHLDTAATGRGVSAHKKNNLSLATTEGSPTERRSMFREDM
ncbi:hypothetical protein LTR08_001310 [Meristemomyces frigidus]|nr:hypothetical protein LTR08_001310 [Meristemomyces frigidus]